MPSAFPDMAIVGFRTVKDYRFQGVHGFFGGGARRNEQIFFDEPLPCGKSMANTLICPDAPSGSETVTKSACITWRIFAAIARKTSRRSRLDVILLVRFSSNWSRSSDAVALH